VFDHHTPPQDTALKAKKVFKRFTTDGHIATSTHELLLNVYVGCSPGSLFLKATKSREMCTSQKTNRRAAPDCWNLLSPQEKKASQASVHNPSSCQEKEFEAHSQTQTFASQGRPDRLRQLAFRLEEQGLGALFHMITTTRDQDIAM
jgi:hypothetical protein